MRKVEEEVAWFDKYFFETEKAANNAVKKDSPLEASIRRNSAKTVGPLYGLELSKRIPNKSEQLLGSTLVIPETLRRNELEIARFEVTHGQYASCRDGVAHHPGTVMDKPGWVHEPKEDWNVPEHNVTLESAQSYVACLSKATGQIWRIPYEDEVKSLYEKREGENTLDYWAGYAPNPEDAAKLREAAKKLNGTAPLLKEVGSFQGQGKEDEAADLRPGRKRGGVGFDARRQRQSDWRQRGLSSGSEVELHACAGVCWVPRGAGRSSRRSRIRTRQKESASRLALEGEAQSHTMVKRNSRARARRCTDLLRGSVPPAGKDRQEVATRAPPRVAPARKPPP